MNDIPESLLVNNTLDYLSASRDLSTRFHGLRLLGRTEAEAIEVCTQGLVPYQIFYDEECYRSEDLPCVAKILIEGDKCTGSHMSS